jgi:hypothetical protein
MTAATTVQGSPLQIVQPKDIDHAQRSDLLGTSLNDLQAHQSGIDESMWPISAEVFGSWNPKFRHRRSAEI